MADVTVSPDAIRARRTNRIGIALKRFLQILASYEVATYALASVQATGLTLPTMVNPLPAENAATCEARLQRVVDEVAGFSSAHPEIPISSLQEGVGARLILGLPKCPAEGRYELLPPGTTARTQAGATIVASRGLVVARCDHESHDHVAFARTAR